MKTFIETLKARRKEKGFTLLSLAKKLNLSDGMISHYEKGISYPSDMILQKICKILDLNFANMTLLKIREKYPIIAFPTKREIFQIKEQLYGILKITEDMVEEMKKQLNQLNNINAQA